MTDDEDFERAGMWIAGEGGASSVQMDKQIKHQYNGRGYDELTRSEQEEVILNQFYKGLSGYKKPTKELVTGINYIRGNNDDFTEKTFTRRGKQYTFIFHGGKFYRSLR